MRNSIVGIKDHPIQRGESSFLTLVSELLTSALKHEDLSGFIQSNLTMDAPFKPAHVKIPF